MRAATRVPTAGARLVRLLLPLVLTLIAPLTVAAQTQPDFSCRGVLVAPDPTGTAARSLAVKQERVVADVHGNPIAPAFRGLDISRSFRDHVQTEHYSISVVGGTVGG